MRTITGFHLTRLYIIQACYSRTEGRDTGCSGGMCAEGSTGDAGGRVRRGGYCLPGKAPLPAQQAVLRLPEWLPSTAGDNGWAGSA